MDLFLVPAAAARPPLLCYNLLCTVQSVTSGVEQETLKRNAKRDIRGRTRDTETGRHHEAVGRCAHASRVINMFDPKDTFA